MQNLEWRSFVDKDLAGTDGVDREGETTSGETRVQLSVVFKLTEHELERSDVLYVDRGGVGNGLGSQYRNHFDEGYADGDPFVGDRVEGVGVCKGVPAITAPCEKFIAIAITFEFDFESGVGGEIQRELKVSGADGDEAAGLVSGDISGEQCAVDRFHHAAFADATHDHIIHGSPGLGQIGDGSKIKQNLFAVGIQRNLRLGRGWAGLKHALKVTHDRNHFKIG